MAKKLVKYQRSTKLSLKFLNKSKHQELNNIVDEYQKLTQTFVNYFWTQDISNLPKYAGSDIYKMFPSFLGAYIRQCAAKQALGIVKGTFQKQKQRLFVYDKLLKEESFKKARKLKQVIDSVNMSCPEIKNVEMEIGGAPTYIKFEESKESNNFDAWLYVSLSQTLLNRSYLPLKKTKHFNKLNKTGKLASGCRISKNFITVSFEFEKQKKDSRQTLGIDIGSKNVISCSNGFQSPKGLNEIQKKLSRKKKGSKAYRIAQIERTNFINWSINQLNLVNIKTIKRENIKNLGRGVRTSRFLTVWTYPEIFEKLDRYCEEQNVSIIKVSPTYTSQRCSVCGWTRKINRKGKEFRCTSCNFVSDADLNASRNIALDLQAIGKKERLSHKNKIGFYWN